MWLLVVPNVEGMWNIRRGTPELRGWNIPGCTVGTVVIERRGDYESNDKQQCSLS